MLYNKVDFFKCFTFHRMYQIIHLFIIRGVFFLKYAKLISIFCL